ncbi:MAG: CDP-2,3-bis-(O-geranylgeranyl)-sn-glycerol synthase [Candidatus Thermoplasmatota archaeon]|jgi:CDP-2,3-bis-(O-geranylgeranyl)-sn-glycerol synthase|nr:CDP-2,3-bis-(O-geranylgeranyl)-sn-glycerol synthase [Candidatus Thermoplasmatota archaeon]
MDYEIILQALWLILPAYIANGSAVLVGGGRPVDFGKNWRDGRRILGDGKTWRGLFAGAFVGMTGGFGLAVAAKYIAMSDFAFLNISDFEGFPLMIPIIFSLCFGALLGDMVESFFKRRIGKERGQDWFVFDQLDFIVGALFLCFFVSTIIQIFGFTSYNWFLKVFSVWHILVLLVLTPFFHIFANFVNKKLQHSKA